MTHRTKMNVEFVALLAAFALFLSTVEYMIPKPIPFMRIGLANLPLIIGLGVLTYREYFLLALLKVIGQGLISGTLFSYIGLFSLGGTLASSTVMLLLFIVFKEKISLLGISIAGATASNVVQIELARLVLFGSAARFIAPPFLIAGLITSILLGLFANRFVATSSWYKKHRESSL
jgi:heptaprenyl diphosphate synthase